MFVSQPTFSYQIRLLEEEVGFQIFERSGTGATLTPAGTQFVTYLTNVAAGMRLHFHSNTLLFMKEKEGNRLLPLRFMQVYYTLHPSLLPTIHLKFLHLEPQSQYERTSYLFSLHANVSYLVG